MVLRGNWQFHGVKRLWDVEQDTENFNNQQHKVLPPQAKKLCIGEGASSRLYMSVGIPNHEHTNSRAYPLPAVHHSHHAQANQSLPTNSVEVYQEFPGYSFTQEQALNFPPQSGTLDQPLPGIQPLLWFPPSVGPEYWEKLAPLSTICQNVTSQTAESLPTRDSTMMNFSSERSRVIENQCWKKTELHRPSTTPTKTAPCDNGYVWPSSCYAGAIHDLNDISQPPSVCSEADQLVPASSAFKAGIAEEHDNLSRLLRNIPSQPVVCNGSDQDSDDATPSALTILSTCQADASAKSPLDSSKEPEDFHESIECNTNNSCMEDPLFVDYDTCFGMVSCVSGVLDRFNASNIYVRVPSNCLRGHLTTQKTWLPTLSSRYAETGRQCTIKTRWSTQASLTTTHRSLW